MLCADRGTSDTSSEQPERHEDLSATVDLPHAAPEIPRPIVIVDDHGLEDTVFRIGVRAAGYFVLLLLFLIGTFLFLQGWPALHKAGLHFFTNSGFQHPRHTPRLRRAGLPGRDARSGRRGHAGRDPGGHRHRPVPQ